MCCRIASLPTVIAAALVINLSIIAAIAATLV